MFYAKKITVTAGTPQRLAFVPTYVQRIVITPLAGAAAEVVYLVAQDPSVTPMATNDNTKVTQLAPATSATVPGLPFVLNRLDSGPALNLQDFGIDGAHSGDLVQVSWEL